jgi:GH35 family endo-1,4-beta-xylanase
MVLKNEPVTDAFSHRKSKKKIRLRYANGNPVANETLQASQTRHEFLFGCSAFYSVELASSMENSSPLSEERRTFLQDRFEKTVALHNFVTLPFYWGRYEPEEGKPKQENTLAAARLFAERNVVTKGHPLCWHFVQHNWLMDYDDDTILAKQLMRIRREVGVFAKLVDMWDVINEVVVMLDFDKNYYDNPMTRVCKKIGRLALVKDVFAAARETSPSAKLLLNDYDTSPNFERLIEEALEAGVPIDAIGIQTHQHKGYMGREKILEILERFSRFKLPLHFTENTLVSGDIMPDWADHANYYPPEWPSTAEGEERQAREMTEMYETLFGHPAVMAVTNWEMADGGWLNAPAGFLRADNSVKPAYQTLMKKVKGEWWTNETITTNADGEAELYGFRGDYRLTVRGLEASLTLDKDEGFIQLDLISEGTPC